MSVRIILALTQIIRVLELVDRIILRFIDVNRKRSSRFSDMDLYKNLGSFSNYKKNNTFSFINYKPNTLCPVHLIYTGQECLFEILLLRYNTFSFY